MKIPTTDKLPLPPSSGFILCNDVTVPVSIGYDKDGSYLIKREDGGVLGVRLTGIQLTEEQLESLLKREKVRL